MLTHLNSSVTALEGIGPRTNQILNRHGIHLLLDLVIPTPQRVAALDGIKASAETVSKWQKMAFLMQSDAVTGQFAEALLRGGCKSLELLSRMSVGKLQRLFEDALNDGIIPRTPSIEELVQMVQESTALVYGSSLSARCILQDGSTIKPVSVKLGLTAGIVSTNGAFRFAAIRPSSRPILVTLTDNRVFKATAYSLISQPDLPGVQTLLLKNEDQVIARETPLSELQGDVLPAMRSYTIKEVVGDASDLQEGDILRFRMAYADGVHVKLHSIYRAFDGIQFLTYTYKVPMKIVDLGLEKGDHVGHRAGLFKKVKITRTGRRLHRLLKMSKRNGPSLNIEDLNSQKRYIAYHLKNLPKNERF